MSRSNYEHLKSLNYETKKKKTTEFCSLVKGFGNFYGKKVAVKQVTKDELDDENIC